MKQTFTLPVLLGCFALLFASPAKADPTDSIAELMVTRANSLLNSGQLDSAVRCGEELLDYSRKKNLPLYESTAWAVFSMVSYQKGEADSAVMQQDTVLAIRRRYYGDNHLQVASAQSNIGAILLDLKGDLDAALGRFREALRICESEKDKCSDNFLAALYNNTGNAQASRNNYEEAEQWYLKSYAIRSKYPDDPRYKLAALLNNLGTLKIETGHTSAAVDYLLLSESLYLKWNNNEETPDLIQVRMNLGATANLEYERKRAKDYFYDALRLGQQFYGNQYLEFGKIHLNLGNVLNEEDSLNAAEKHYRTAYEFWESNFGFHPDQTVALLGLGILASKRGDDTEALRLYEEAKTLNEANFPAKHDRKAYTYHEIGVYHSKKGDSAKARAYFLKQLSALGIEEIRPAALASAPPSNLMVTGLTNLGITHFEEYKATSEVGQLDAALRVFALADSVVQKLRELRLSFSEQNELLRHARLLTEWAMQAEMARYGPKTESIFNRSEQNRGLNLYGKFREDAAVRFSGVPDSLVSNHRKLQYEIAYFEKKLREMPPSDSNFHAVQTKTAELRLAMSALKDKLAGFEKYHKFRFGTASASLADVQKKILKKGELMVQYFEGDSVIFVFLVSQDRYDVQVITKDFGLEEKVEAMRWGITAYYASRQHDEALLLSSIEQYEKNALELYQRLIAPLHLRPADSLLVIVPDGVLWLLPFDALLSQSPEMLGDFKSYPYLLKNHRINYAYSATLLREAETQPRKKMAAKSLFACAPFDKPYPELKSIDGFPVLPESRWEVDMAWRALGGDTLIGRLAVKNRVLESLTDYRIILFSTHAKAGDEGYAAFFPEASSRAGQNRLFTTDVYNLEVAADVVIFSACETTLGKSMPGEGLISLARAFTYAGARGLLATHWEMNDFSSSRIIASVCGQLSNDVPAHHAIWNAKREWLSTCSAEGAHPWFWAGTIGLGFFGAANP